MLMKADGLSLPTIHIVEDDYAVLDALALTLSDLGYVVCSYTTAESFLAEARAVAGDIVFIDLGLPGIGGVELIKALRSQVAPPRVIAMSGKPRNLIGHHLRELPEIGVLRKPISAQMLAAELPS